MKTAETSPRSILDRCAHPVLFGVYPVLFLLARNIDEMNVTQALRPFAVCALYAWIVWRVTGLFVRNAHRAGAIASLVVALTFLFQEYGQAWWQIVLVTAFAVPLIGLLARRGPSGPPITRFLNVCAIALLLYSAVEIVPMAVRRGAAPERSIGKAEATEMVPEHLRGLAGKTPNIYFIILDGYGRADVLNRFYGFDNTPFTDFLRGQGFYVADQARSNYSRTIFSIPSTLNFTHLGDFIETYNLEEETDLKPLAKLMEQNRVFYFLKQFGYTTYAYHTGMTDLLLYNADHVYSAPFPISSFEHALIARTPFVYLLGYAVAWNGYYLHHQSVRHALEGLHASLKTPGPKFVLGHIVCPHPPFVFDSNGNYVSSRDLEFKLTDGDSAIGDGMLTVEEYRKGYAAQTQWLNGEVAKWVESARTQDPGAIIILQGDHGPGSMFKWNSFKETNMLERFSILNAMYLPGGGEEVLYPGITSVNTFRVVFDRYFGMEYPLLPDTSYFAEERHPLYLYEIGFAPPAPIADMKAPQE